MPTAPYSPTGARPVRRGRDEPYDSRSATIGSTLAVLSALTNFAFLPYYPFWAMTIIALDVFIIWALASHGREGVG